MQEQITVGAEDTGPWSAMPTQRLAALLALVGSRRMGLEALRSRTKLTPPEFRRLLEWLHREYLVDVVSTLDGELIEEAAALTEKGEALLLSLLERTCELPEFR